MNACTQETERGVTLAEFIARETIVMRAVPDGRRRSDDGWEFDAWICCLSRQQKGRRMTVPFKMGLGHKGAPPALADVLDCLAMDAASLEDYPQYEDWAPSLGFDPDSRKGFAVYETCRKQSERLKRFLGEDAYETLLWHTERE